MKRVNASVAMTYPYRNPQRHGIPLVGPEQLFSGVLPTPLRCPRPPRTRRDARLSWNQGRSRGVGPGTRPSAYCRTALRMRTGASNCWWPGPRAGRAGRPAPEPRSRRRSACRGNLPEHAAGRRLTLANASALHVWGACCATTPRCEEGPMRRGRVRDGPDEPGLPFPLPVP